MAFSKGGITVRTSQCMIKERDRELDETGMKFDKEQAKTYDLKADVAKLSEELANSKSDATNAREELEAKNKEARDEIKSLKVNISLLNEIFGKLTQDGEGKKKELEESKAALETIASEKTTSDQRAKEKGKRYVHTSAL